MIKIIGAMFIISSGLIYTFERVCSILSSSIVKAGFFSGGMTGAVPEVEVVGVFDNVYIPGLFIGGILILIYGFFIKENNGSSMPERTSK